MIRRRIVRVAAVYAALAGAAAACYLFVQKTGMGIPCVFRRLSGFRCPGCGNTRAVTAYVHFRWKEGLRYNYLFPAELGFVLLLAFSSTRRYLKTGVRRVETGNKRLDIGFLFVLMVWWVLRNLLNL